MLEPYHPTRDQEASYHRLLFIPCIILYSAVPIFSFEVKISRLKVLRCVQNCKSQRLRKALYERSVSSKTSCPGLPVHQAQILSCTTTCMISVYSNGAVPTATGPRRELH